MQSQFEILKITRQNVLKTIQNLSDEQLLRVPQGFNNNILWNMGHIVSSTQKLTYGLAGLSMRVEENFVLPFPKGSSPAQWTTTPAIKQVKEYLASTATQLQEDYNTGLLNKEFKSYETSYGFKINSIEDALSFLNIHESLHFGSIMALKKLV